MLRFLLALILLSAFAVSQPINMPVFPCDDFMTPLTLGEPLSDGQETWFGDRSPPGYLLEPNGPFPGLFIKTWGGLPAYDDPKWIWIPYDPEDPHFEALWWFLASGLHRAVSVIVKRGRVISYAGMQW